ncbi:MAG: UDP-N-acetylmuramoyl-tripeptide--D-alanyl-D-alanine ligase, partial [Stackebrandtia sp.]
PYTVCRADADTRYLVLELGARNVGDIKALCEVAPPHVGAVLNIGVAHLDGFGSLEATAQAKGELVEAVGPDGHVVLNADDPRTAAMTGRSRAPVVTFGAENPASVYATHVESDRGRPKFTLHTPLGSAATALRLHGRHHVANALAAAAAAHALGMSPGDIAAALGEAERKSPRRMDVYTRADGVTVVDDSYNANPASTAAALRALAEIADGRKIAVLGYMADLMDDEIDAHRELGRNAARAGVDVLIVVDKLAAPVGEAARDHGVEVIDAADQAQAVEALGPLLRPGDTVLVKASRYRTWEVADYLRNPRALTREAHA